MELKVKHILLSAVLYLFSLGVYGQFPPPPVPMADAVEDPNAPICPPPEDLDNNPDTPPVIPPGLPCRVLPIDDYLWPLLIAGLILGGYRFYKLEETSA